jgi:hypothetical protein
MRRAFNLLAMTNLGLLFATPFAFGAGEVVIKQQRESRERSITIRKSSGSAARISAPASGTVLETWPITGGNRTTQESALEDALKKAEGKLGDYLRSIRPESNWSANDLRRFVIRMKSANDQIPRDDEIKIDGNPTFAASIELQLTKEIHGELLRQLRLDEARERQWGLSRYLFGALALFAAIGLYYRFDERTKGYYTNWLRLGAVVFLGLAVYGIRHLP